MRWGWNFLRSFVSAFFTLYLCTKKKQQQQIISNISSHKSQNMHRSWSEDNVEIFSYVVGCEIDRRANIYLGSKHIKCINLIRNRKKMRQSVNSNLRLIFVFKSEWIGPTRRQQSSREHFHEYLLQDET